MQNHQSTRGVHQLTNNSLSIDQRKIINRLTILISQLEEGSINQTEDFQRTKKLILTNPTSSVDQKPTYVDNWAKDLLFNKNILNFKWPKASPTVINPILMAISREKSIKENTYQSFEGSKSIEKRKKEHPLLKIQRVHILTFKALFFIKKLHSKKIEVPELYNQSKESSSVPKLILQRFIQTGVP